MKKIFYLLFAGAIVLTACKDELPEANFELAQVSAFTATAGDAQVALAWTPADGFSPSEYYLSWVSATTGVEGGERTLDVNTTAIAIDELMNEVNYTFSIQPRYEKGLAGKVSATAKPMNSRFPATNFTARAGNALARLAWTKPASGQLSGYQITVIPGNQVIDVNTPATESYTVAGLTNGQAYTFSIVGIYPQGQSEAVTASATPGLIFPVVVTSATLTLNNACTFEYNDMYFGENVQSVSWNFGDGATSTEEAPMHAYTATGNYTVTVTVTYAGSGTDSGSLDIVVGDYKWGERALDHNGLTGYVKTSNPVFSPDGQTMYVPTSSPNGHLFAVSVQEGTIKWVFSITELTYGGGAMVHPGSGAIYQGSDAAIYAINPDGTQKWKVIPTGSGASARVRAFPALSADGTEAYFLSNSSLYALNAASGTEVWKKQLSDLNTGISIGSAVLVGSDGTVYIGTNQGIYAFSSSGNLTWQTATKYNVTESGSMAIHGNVLYATLKGTDGLVAVNTADGSQAWTTAAGGDAYFPIVDKNGVIYFTEKLAAGKVYAINPNGTQKWVKNIERTLNYGGLVLDKNGVIYGGTQGSGYKRFAINTTTGDFVISEESVQQIMAAFTIGPDKRLYWGTIGSGNIGTLYTLEINAELETGSWSVRGGDLQGTNRQK